MITRWVLSEWTLALLLVVCWLINKVNSYVLELLCEILHLLWNLSGSQIFREALGEVHDLVARLLAEASLLDCVHNLLGEALLLRLLLLAFSLWRGVLRGVIALYNLDFENGIRLLLLFVEQKQCLLPLVCMQNGDPVALIVLVLDSV